MTARWRIVFVGFLSLCCIAPGTPPGHAKALAQTTAQVLPVLKRDYLLNGLQLIVSEQKGPGGVSARLRIDSGAAFDKSGKGGLADITAAMLLKGGGGLDSKTLADSLGQLGLTINISVDWDSTNLTFAGPADSLESIFDLIGRLVITPTFDQKELDALKTQRTAAMAEQAGNDAQAALRKAMETVFGSHPYGHPIRGTAESISQISRADLLYYHGRFYLANNAALIITGDVKAEDVTRLARTKLGSWKKGDKVPPSFQPPEPLKATRVVMIDRPSQNAQAVAAQVGISRRDKDYIAAVVMTEVLKANIARRVAALPGAALQVGLDARFLAGPLWVTFSSSPGNLGQALDVVLSTMTDLQSQQAALDQVESAKARIVSSFSERLASPEGAAEVVLDVETYGLGRDYLMNFAPRVNAVTPADVQRVARGFLAPQALAIAVAGPAGASEEGLKKLGSVTIVKP